MEINFGDPRHVIIPPGQDVKIGLPSGLEVNAPAMYFVAAMLQLLDPIVLQHVLEQVAVLVRANGNGKAVCMDGSNGRIVLR